MATTKRQISGSVGVEVKGDKLRLRLPRAIAVGSQRYISTRLGNIPDNFKRLQVVAWQIEADIRDGRIADTIHSYFDQFQVESLDRVVLVPLQPMTLNQLWGKYCDFKRPQLTVTTYTRDYSKKWANHLAKLPQELSQPVAIRDTLVATVSSDTAKRLLTLLSACGEWAVGSELIKVNPFMSMATGINRSKSSQTINPFSNLSVVLS